MSSDSDALYNKEWHFSAAMNHRHPMRRKPLPMIGLVTREDAVLPCLDLYKPAQTRLAPAY
jgi:hypothetical protein